MYDNISGIWPSAGSDSSPRKVLSSLFLFPIHHRTTQEVKRKSVKPQDTCECPNENRSTCCHPSLFLCKTNDVLVTPKGISLSLLHRGALQKSQAHLTGFLHDTVMYPSLQQSHKGHACLYSMLKKNLNWKTFPRSRT